ncbi:hypothetical protein [Bradyrhizobium sp. Tv2a-2]|uniref:hypothetical protein n=1 Tax=Bradyrhizobium sp. Tv2a-2 TaxID=113395 RepID=UPI000465CE6E|nr:hypothetical protein [Bradyrhizobium sp. Tv2a-2]
MSPTGSWEGQSITWSKRILIFLALFGLYGGDFFYFLVPPLGYWLPIITLVLAMPLAFVFLAAIFKRRWKLATVFALAWALVGIHFAGSRAASEWVRVQGFRLHTLLVRDYSSGCDLTEFVENGVKQSTGTCEGFDRGNYFDVIVYDTTGEFVLPAAQRTPAWKQAMATTISRVVVSEEDRASHLFGNFYHVYVRSEELLVAIGLSSRISGQQL